MKRNGSVTVFLAMVFLLISALLCALVESARTAGARFYLRTMADSAIDSVFSEYNRKLWDSYRLILLESRNEEKTVESMNGYMKPYVKNCGWYAMAEPSSEITEKTYITDDGGVWFEQEVKDYMKYGWLSSGFSAESAQKIWKQIKEAGAMDSITKAYGLRSKEAVRMEKAVSKISDNLKSQTRLKSTAASELLSGDNASFQQTAGMLEGKIQALPSLIDDYTKKADAFGLHLDAVKTEHAADFEKLEKENREALEKQIASYREYTDEDGVRRKELEALDDNSSNTLKNISEVRTLADKTEEWIEEAEADDDDGDSGVDAGAMWQEVADAWENVSLSSFEGASGVRDEKTETLLESVSGFAEDSLLKLVLPEGRTVSDGKMDLSAFPSKTNVSARTDTGIDLVTAAAVDEYAGKYLPDFTDKSTRPIAYELEYTISGAGTDRSNLTSALLQILAVREGLNFLHIMTNDKKRSEARTLAVTIAGSTALPALAGLLQCLIMAAWALIESLMDIKALLSGKKIALIKTERDWMIGLKEVLTIAATQKLPDADIKESSLGIDYEMYLKLLLFTKTAEERDYRIMDMIQLNMAREESGFLLQNCIYGMHAKVTCSSRHLFTSLGISDTNTVLLSPDFQISAETVKAY
jgi:hypothetical protein